MPGLGLEQRPQTFQRKRSWRNHCSSGHPGAFAELFLRVGRRGLQLVRNSAVLGRLRSQALAQRVNESIRDGRKDVGIHNPILRRKWRSNSPCCCSSVDGSAAASSSSRGPLDLHVAPFEQRRGVVVGQEHAEAAAEDGARHPRRSSRFGGRASRDHRRSVLVAAWIEAREQEHLPGGLTAISRQAFTHNRSRRETMGAGSQSCRPSPTAPKNSFPGRTLPAPGQNRPSQSRQIAEEFCRCSLPGTGAAASAAWASDSAASLAASARNWARACTRALTCSGGVSTRNFGCAPVGKHLANCRPLRRRAPCDNRPRPLAAQGPRS